MTADRILVRMEECVKIELAITHVAVSLDSEEETVKLVRIVIVSDGMKNSCALINMRFFTQCNNIITTVKFQ